MTSPNAWSDPWGAFDMAFKSVVETREKLSELSTNANGLRLSLEVPGVSPASIKVQRCSKRIRISWIDRLGAAQERVYDVPGQVDGITAKLTHGLLIVDVVVGGESAEWEDVSVSKE